MGLGTFSFQSTRDTLGEGAAEPAPAAPTHPNIMGCGWPPALCTPENTWSYLCISPALAQPHTALRTVMGISCVSLRAWQCDPRAGSLHKGKQLMTLIQASVGESKTQFYSTRVFQKLYKAQAPLLWCRHMQPQTPPAPLDVIARSCSPVGALPDIQVPLCCRCGGKTED